MNICRWNCRRYNSNQTMQQPPRRTVIRDPRFRSTFSDLNPVADSPLVFRQVPLRTRRGTCYVGGESRSQK